MVVFVTDEKAEERFSICSKCERLTELGICSECSCVMPMKVKLTTSVCPKGKW